MGPPRLPLVSASEEFIAKAKAKLESIVWPDGDWLHSHVGVQGLLFWDSPSLGMLLMQWAGLAVISFRKMKVIGVEGLAHM